MITLSNLVRSTPEKSVQRVGRGPGSGRGKTSGRGHKGQMSRSGSKRKPGFEGGQMPLLRRLPKRGFNNARYKVEYSLVNLDTFKDFLQDSVITPELLVERGVVKNLRKRIKILGMGTMQVPCEVHAHGFSKSAKKKIEEAKGTWKIIKFQPFLKRKANAESKE